MHRHDAASIRNPRLKGTLVRNNFSPFASGLLAMLLTSACGGETAPAAPPPPEVLVADVERRDVPCRWSSWARRKGSQDVEIRARVEGFLERRGVRRGLAGAEGAGALSHRSASRSRRRWPTRRPSWRRPRRGSRRPRTTSSACKPLAAKQAVSQQELDNAVAAEDAATRAGGCAQGRGRECARSTSATPTSPRRSTAWSARRSSRPGASSAAARARCSRPCRRSIPILFRAGISEAEYLRIARRADELRKARGGKPDARRSRPGRRHRPPA